MKINVPTPRWAIPLIPPCRYKGAKGGRGGGKSHFMVGMAAARMAADPDYKVAGIREVQKSVKYSIKALLEAKIHEQGTAHLFDIQDQVIKRKQGSGIAIFLGMQDHTADAVKGLEDFDLGLVDEANALSASSLKKLTPTFRKEGSEVHFAWNPENENDPIDAFFARNEGDPDFTLVTVNVTDNPFVSDTALADYHREEALYDAARARITEAQRKEIDPDPADLALVDTFEHVWLGGYNKRSQKIVFHNWTTGIIEPPKNIIWSFGVDWGFANDPLAGTKTCLIPPEEKGEAPTLYVRQAITQIGVRTEDTVAFLKRLDGIEKWPSRADSARPELIDYCKRNGLPKMRKAKKGPGSLMDGTAFLLGCNIVVHPTDAEPFKEELKNHSFKVIKHTGEITSVIEDSWNHCLDGTRYAHEGSHRKGKFKEPERQEPAKPEGRSYFNGKDDGSSWKTA